jgi:hypothetical protein
MTDPGIFISTMVKTPQASEGALERARLRAEYFGIHAAENMKVREFRRTIIAQPRPRARSGAASTGATTAEDGSGDADYATVSPEVARAFLTSPTAAMLEVEDFEGLGLSVVDRLKDLSLVDFNHHGNTFSFTVRLDVLHREPIELPITVPASTVSRAREPWEGAPELVRRGSVLYELHWLSQRLSEQFPWHPQGAAWFVLTGEFPIRPLIEASLEVRESREPPYTDARITFSVDATLPPGEVAHCYAEVRDQLLGGPRIRRAETRTLEIFRFVSARRLHCPSSTWGELVREWDQSYPEDWRFDGNEKAFQVYWRRGYRSVFPEFRATPEEEPVTTEQA